jgi:pimeloyl-ACP methyl ester carboxylesterase
MTRKLLSLATLTLSVATAHAAPVIQLDDATFYATPAATPNSHGELLSYRPAAVNLKGSDLSSANVNAWNVKYTTHADVDAASGVQSVATGTVFVPKSGAKGVILYAVGTHGLGAQCAPSRQLSAGVDYEIANIAAALKAGYAVLVTDYMGYTSGKRPSYMVGASEGRSVLDIFKAAQQIPGSGVKASYKVAIWGYSQGGQASAFAAQLAPSYAPEITVVGVASGGTIADFVPTANHLNKRNGSSFLFQTILGLNEEYGESGIPFNAALTDNQEQRTSLLKVRSQCVFEALYDYQNQDLAQYTKPGFTLDALIARPDVAATLEAQKLGKTKVNFPVYLYHGAADEFIPLSQSFELKKRWCALANNVKFDLYPGEHIITQFQGAGPALAWITDRFNNAPATNTCHITTPPVDTSNPTTGNIIVSMKAWPLTAQVTIKGMNQTVHLPSDSTFSSESDVNAKVLNGSLQVPDFKQSMKILGIGAQIGLKIAPVGDASGTVELGRDGSLKVAGVAKADITVTSVWGIPFGQCKTEKPVLFPLNYTGPLSGLGAGLTFSGTTTFPPIKGCIISAIISSLMSGAGQQYTFAVNPPAPKAN